MMIGTLSQRRGRNSVNELDLTDRLDLAVRAHVRPGARFPEAVWAGGDVRLLLWAKQAADVARVLGIGTGLPLGMELPEVGVQASVSGEVDGVAMVQLPERDALRLAALLEDADRATRRH
ncbi:hypothetical protein OHU11_41840 (plasmid) [Streptomyces sp. NBC_00257]|uniref:hypothetical protein n=1 Tax=unclassified Streptomyces TaxID=2593676 RepID=UPI00224D4C0B|nr:MULTISPECIES: hypothetical protein [unclassified Streptomyces]MCX5434724.1 hypothetical protein [Streptomyces sp. NBC_00062]